MFSMIPSGTDSFLKVGDRAVIKNTEAMRSIGLAGREITIVSVNGRLIGSNILKSIGPRRQLVRLYFEREELK